MYLLMYQSLSHTRFHTSSILAFSKIEPESLHALFYILLLFTLEHPNRVMNDLLMLDYWSKKEEAESLQWSAMRTISLQCSSCTAMPENSATAVSWSVMPLNLLNVITLIWIRCQLALLKLLFHFPSCNRRSVFWTDSAHRNIKLC